MEFALNLVFAPTGGALNERIHMRVESDEDGFVALLPRSSLSRDLACNMVVPHMYLASARCRTNVFWP